MKAEESLSDDGWNLSERIHAKLLLLLAAAAAATTTDLVV